MTAGRQSWEYAMGRVISASRNTGMRWRVYGYRRPIHGGWAYTIEPIHFKLVAR